MSRRFCQLLFFLCWTSIAVALLFLLTEGFSSFLLFAKGVRQELKSPKLPDRLHTRYDPNLGWVNVSNGDFPSMWARGAWLKTNSAGYRNTVDFPVDVPPGKIRVICSGDSFTFGWGVSNDETWCYHLSELRAGIESVNLGHNGYGLDQSYLLYKRESQKLKHQLHLFAFVSEDLSRMRSNSMFGYAKPVITVTDGRLKVENVPVPRTPYALPWFSGAVTHIPPLRMFELYRLVRPKRSAPLVALPGDEKLILKLILSDLLRMADENQATLVLIHLPARHEFPERHDLLSESPFRGLFSEILVDNLARVRFVDLYPVFAAIPSKAQFLSLFRGHYSAKGNEFVARKIMESVADLIELRKKEASAPAK